MLLTYNSDIRSLSTWDWRALRAAFFPRRESRFWSLSSNAVFEPCRSFVDNDLIHTKTASLLSYTKNPEDTGNKIVSKHRISQWAAPRKHKMTAICHGLRNIDRSGEYRTAFWPPVMHSAVRWCSTLILFYIFIILIYLEYLLFASSKGEKLVCAVSFAI